jgi:hypothetical protein
MLTIVASAYDFKAAAVLVEGRKLLSAMFWTVLGTSLKPHLPLSEPLSKKLKFTQQLDVGTALN